MTHTASCGHSLIDDPDDDFENDGMRAAVKEYDKLGNRCIAYKTLCGACYNKLAEENTLCYSYIHELEWMRGE